MCLECRAFCVSCVPWVCPVPCVSYYVLYAVCLCVSCVLNAVHFVCHVCLECVMCRVCLVSVVLVEDCSLNAFRSAPNGWLIDSFDHRGWLGIKNLLSIIHLIVWLINWVSFHFLFFSPPLKTSFPETRCCPTVDFHSCLVSSVIDQWLLTFEDVLSSCPFSKKIFLCFRDPTVGWRTQKLIRTPLVGARDYQMFLLLRSLE